MEKYQKINTLYKRYAFNGKDCPNKKWLRMRNKIIMGLFSDKTTEYLFNQKWEAYSKIDGTNCKIAYFPSTCEIRVEGKEEKSNDQQGMFAYLTAVGERIRPTLMELFPKESAKFTPIRNKDTKAIKYRTVSGGEPKKIDADYFLVELEEVPVYIYGEYFGRGIQKCGKRYLEDSHDFLVFDIKLQGWWTPKEVRDELCEKLGLEQVPYYGTYTLKEIEDNVMMGFPTLYKKAADKTLLEEGLVCRPIVPLSSGNDRIIVKVKTCDYIEYLEARKDFTDEEFEEFKNWYFTEIEGKV